MAPVTEEVEDMLEHVLSSYEDRIQCVGALFETTHDFLLGFQDSVVDAKTEQEKINDQLKENLAKNSSLRRKDFDSMMRVISCHQDRQERSVRYESQAYLKEQEDLVQELRETLRQFRGALANGEAERIKEFQALTKRILDTQEIRKREVIVRLREIEKEQQETREMLKNLLARGRDLRTKDFKSMLTKFREQRQQRHARQREREQEVQSLLGRFKQERSGLTRSRSRAHENAQKEPSA